MSEVLEYLDKKAQVYKIEDGANGKEARVRICFMCRADGYHLYVNVRTGVFHCKRCGEGGSFLTLKEKLGDVLPIHSMQELAGPEVPTQLSSLEDTVILGQDGLANSRKALKYLVDERLFSPEAIAYFRLGLISDEDGEWIMYPYVREGEVVNIKYRSFPPKKTFKRVAGRPSVLYNGDVLKGLNSFVILCEGEADVVSLWSHGFREVIGSTVGAKGISSDWIVGLDRFQKIYFAYDNDDDGQEGAYKFATRLGLERCFRIKLPTGTKDVNVYFQNGGTTEEFQSLVDSASPFDVQHVSNIAEEIKKGLVRWKTKSNEEDKLHFPWAKLDYLTDSMIAGDLVILSSKPGVGKSSMAFRMLYHYAANDIPCLLFELEMRPERIMPRIVASHTGVDSKTVPGNADLLASAWVDMRKFPLYFAYVYKKPAFELIADTIRKCVKVYGIKFVVFDNLHFLCRTTTDQTREVSIVVQSFKLLAEELAIPILTIARPRKNTGKIIANVDLKDSADIEGDSDMIILLHRELKQKGEMAEEGTEGIFEEKMLVRVSKCRFAAGGDTYFRVDDAKCRMEEI